MRGWMLEVSRDGAQKFKVLVWLEFEKARPELRPAPPCPENLGNIKDHVPDQVGETAGGGGFRKHSYRFVEPDNSFSLPQHQVHPRFPFPKDCFPRALSTAHLSSVTCKHQLLARLFQAHLQVFPERAVRLRCRNVIMLQAA
jgi:hypothetical protein